MHPGRVFTPGEASVAALRRHLAAVGASRVVVVQPSVYSNDNRCTQEAIGELGPSARGVCVIDGASSKAQLSSLDAAGFRGARLNLHTVGIGDPQALVAEVDGLRRLLPSRWHIQTYCAPALLEAMRPLARALEVPLVLDHFAGVGALADKAAPDLLALLDTGNVYLKLSAPERTASPGGESVMADMVRLLGKRYPERLLWGSDWPHPGTLGNSPRIRDGIEPFRPVDDAAVLRRLLAWLDDDAVIHAMLVSNPERLYGFDPADRAPPATG